MKVTRVALLACIELLLCSSCARDVTVGHEDSLAQQSGAAGTGHDASLLWSADHETADLEQWLADDSGINYVERSGELELTTEHARSGAHALRATLSADDGELHQAVMGRNLSLLEGRYGAWYLLPEAPRTGGWVIMKLSNGSTADRFDINIVTAEAGTAHLRIWEHEEGWISELAPVPFPVGRWVHVEALYRSTSEADGYLTVLQDGAAVLDTGLRATAASDRVTFFVGSTSRGLLPVPHRSFIDDATIHAW